MSIISKETIEVIAQSIGITNLSPDVTLTLALAVEYSLREIIQESIKCMRHSKRTVLTADDVDSALGLKNVVPIYGFASGDPLRFKRAVGHNDIFYIDDRDMDFKEVIEEPLTKAPIDTAVVAHWLAIEGMQPAIPENAPVEGKSNNAGVGVVTRIPEDILHYAILPWLPYKTLAKLKIVCRKWHHLISYDPLFAHEQSRRGSPTFSGFVYVGDKEDCIKFLSIDDAPAAVSSFSSPLPTTYVADIIACANGLLLLLIHNGVERSYYLWNPARNQGHFVPESGRGYGFLHVGLAFDPLTTPRCRLVNLMLECQGEGMVECSFEMFSSDRGKWVLSNQKVVTKLDGYINRNSVLYAAGVLHWSLIPNMVRFDVDKNVAGLMPLPVEQVEDNTYDVLGVTGEGILTYTQLRPEIETTIIWTMSKDGEWIRRHRFSLHNIMDAGIYSVRPLPFVGGDKIYMDADVTVDRPNLICCNTKTGEMVLMGEVICDPLCHYIFIDYNSMARIGSFEIC